jgi:hypothetical protein
LLHLDSDLARAALAEKWAMRRAPLLRALDRAIGLSRTLEERAPVVLAGVGRVTVPRGWLVERSPSRASDPSGRVVVALTTDASIVPATLPAARGDRGDLAYAIHHRGTRRTLVATDDDRREVIVTYDAPLDLSWALAEWERILSTLELR